VMWELYVMEGFEHWDEDDLFDCLGGSDDD
jgi:hypothetical protein